MFLFETHIGLNTDTEVASGNGSIIAILKRMRTLLNAAQWAPVQMDSVTANDSDKAFTVPAGTEWQPLSVYVELTTTATVGNRQMVVEFRDASGNVIASARAAVTQAASLTRKYLFAVGVDRLWSFLDTDHLTTPLPVSVLPAGYDVHVWDKAAIDTAADDMTVRIIADARSV